MKHSIGAFTICALFLSAAAMAQTPAGRIAGFLYDGQTGSPLAGANVALYAAANAGPGARPLAGTISGADGRFRIEAPPEGRCVLRASYIGYRREQRDIDVKAGGDVRLELRLLPDIVGLDEVVVTGAASRTEKSRSEVAVSRLDASQYLEGNQYQDLSQLLAGKIAGVRVAPSSGNAGSGVRFSMRSGAGLFGSGQPVIFVDGTRMLNTEIGEFSGGQSISTLADLNPADVEHVEVLKGPAAAALYGTSGSNGVVLVTTKRGRRGALPGTYSLQYTISSGWNERAVEYTPAMALSYHDANALFRTGPLTEQRLGISGATGALDYYAGIEHRGETGILPNSRFGRTSVRGNAGILASDKLRLSVSSNVIFSDAELPQNDNSLVGMYANTLIFGPPSAGGPGSYVFADSASVRAITSLTRMRRFLGSIEAEYAPLPALTLRGTLGYDGASYRTEQQYPANRDYSGIGVSGGWRGLTDNTRDQISADLNASYRWSAGSGLEAITILGAQAYASSFRNTSIYKTGFPNALITNIGAGANFDRGDELFTDLREAGVFLQQELAYEDRYFFSAGLRNDYASSIGTKAPNIFYPRASAAARLDRFGALPPWVSLLKARLAYGESGILPAPLDASGLRWGASPSGGGTGAELVFIGNPAIEPERVREFEIGVEAEFARSFGFDLSWYRQFARNSIIAFLNPPSTGLTASATPRNVGAIEGWGLEVDLYARLFRSEHAKLDARLVWTYADNQVTDMGGSAPIQEGVNAIVTGSPRFALYAHPVLGAAFMPDGSYAGPLIDSVPRFLGTPVPTHSGSFSLSLRVLKHLTLSAQLDAAFGATVHNRTRVYQTLYNNNAGYNELATRLGVAADYGITPVPGVDALTPGTGEYRTAAESFARMDPTVPGASAFFESGDFLRLRELSLRYDLTEALSALLGRAYVGPVSLALSGRNLVLITDYSGPDPEVNSAGAAGIVQGRDFLTLQNPRVYTATVSIGL